MFHWMRRKPVVVDEDGRSYREQLLRAIMRVSTALDDNADPNLVAQLHVLLRDMHTLEYGVKQNESAELHQEMEGLLKRIERLEAIVKVREYPTISSQQRIV